MPPTICPRCSPSCWRSRTAAAPRSCARRPTTPCSSSGCWTSVSSTCCCRSSNPTKPPRPPYPAPRYPPRGSRGGSNARRCNRYGAQTEYASQIHDNVCVLLQIETRAGIEALERILQVPGVDGIFIGPADLSAALGHFGDPNHRQVQAAIADIHARSRAAGKAVGILTTVEADARRYIEQGFQFVAVGTDQALFRAATQGLRDRFPSGDPGALPAR